jgi:hypothetical protein
MFGILAENEFDVFDPQPRLGGVAKRDCRWSVNIDDPRPLMRNPAPFRDDSILNQQRFAGRSASQAWRFSPSYRRAG